MANVVLTRTSTASQIRKALLEQIMTGVLAPGTRIKELHLARQFSTSQGPVREAIRELETAGLVVTEPYRGTRVREVTERETREAYSVRAVLEDLAGRLAARYSEPNAGDLRELAQAVRIAAEANDRQQYATRDLEFHRAIVIRARNEVLLRNWCALEFEMRIPLVLDRLDLNLVAAQAVHWDVVRAIEAGDGVQAGALLNRHCSSLFAESAS